MIISLLVIIVVVVSSFYYTDIDHQSAFFSMFLPLIFVAALIALALWLVAFFHKTGINQHAERGDAGGGFWGDGGGGGDSGC